MHTSFEMLCLSVNGLSILLTRSCAAATKAFLKAGFGTTPAGRQPEQLSTLPTAWGTDEYFSKQRTIVSSLSLVHLSNVASPTLISSIS